MNLCCSTGRPATADNRRRWCRERRSRDERSETDPWSRLNRSGCWTGRSFVSRKLRSCRPECQSSPFRRAWNQRMLRRPSPKRQPLLVMHSAESVLPVLTDPAIVTAWTDSWASCRPVFGPAARSWPAEPLFSDQTHSYGFLTECTLSSQIHQSEPYLQIRNRRR